MTDAKVHDLTQERFLEPAEVAMVFRRTVPWVYNNSLPEKGLRKAGFLFPAARRFNAKTLLFDRAEIERIISASETGSTAEIRA